MTRLIARRFVLMAVVLVAMTFVTFMLVEIIPGDPARTAAGQNPTPQAVEAARIRLGLNKPILVQYGIYLDHLLHGSLGQSVFTHRPIAADLADVVPSSIELVLAAMLINVCIAIPLGVIAAVNRNRFVDAIARLLVMTFAGVPVFWLGLMLQFFLAAQLGWFPLTGQVAPQLDVGHRITGMLTVDTLIQGKFPAFLSAVQHLVLPAFTLAAAYISVVTRTIRSTMIGALERDFITLARAKGLSEWRVVVHHALRNALVPSTTIIGMQFGWMLGSTVLVETIFGRTGLGSYAVTAVLQSDLWAVIGVVLVVGVFFVVANFLVDLAYIWLNPKLRPEVM